MIYPVDRAKLGPDVAACLLGQFGYLKSTEFTVTSLSAVKLTFLHSLLDIVVDATLNLRSTLH